MFVLASLGFGHADLVVWPQFRSATFAGPQDIPPVYAPYFPSLQREQWYVLLSVKSSKTVIMIKEIKDLKQSVRHRL